jgi:Fe2+ or Zn2+ uptake regulation protein
LEFRLRQVASRLGFTLTDHVIALRGTCAHCAGHS